MVRNIDVKAELRKLTSNKPVHAVAGAGVLASRTLMELPSRLVQWTRDNPPNSLPGRANEAVQSAQTRANGAVQGAQTRANGYVQSAQSRANGYVQTARTKAADRYDKLAEQGKKALNGQSNGTESQSTTQSPSTTQSRSAAQGKGDLNGKPKGKAPSSRTATSN